MRKLERNNNTTKKYGEGIDIYKKEKDGWSGTDNKRKTGGRKTTKASNKRKGDLGGTVITKKEAEKKRTRGGKTDKSYQ